MFKGVYNPAGDEFSFSDFKIKIKERLSARIRRELGIRGNTPAAVLILIMNKNGSPHVLITRRTQNVATHKGQMSLPGGAMDKGDRDIEHTALRETLEETGVAPEAVEILGRFDDYETISGFHVATFAGAVDYPVEYSFNEHEIDGYSEVPLKLFIEMAGTSSEIFKHDGQDITLYTYHYEEFTIWGLTALILTDFAQKILS